MFLKFILYYKFYLLLPPEKRLKSTILFIQKIQQVIRLVRIEGEAICYSRDNDAQAYSVFKAPQQGQVARFTLIHVEGGFQCSSTSNLKSMWGCSSKPNVVITTSSNVVLEPSRALIRNSTLTAAINGRLTLVYLRPLKVKPEEEFRIWTRESFIESGDYDGERSSVTGFNCVQISMGYLDFTNT